MPRSFGRWIRRVRRGLAQKLWRGGTRLIWASLATSLLVALNADWQPMVHSVVSVLLYGVAVGWTAAAAVLVAGRNRRRRGEAIRVEGDGDRILFMRHANGKTVEVPLDSLEDGFVIPPFGRPPAAEHPPTAVLRLKDGTEWWVETESIDEALELLSVSGLSPERRKIRVKRRLSGTVVLSFLASILAMPAPIAAVVVVVGGAKVMAGMWLFPIIWGLIWWRILRVMQPTDLDIGSDGVAWGRGKKRRFVPYRAVRSIHLEGERLTLDTDEGELEIRFGPIDPAQRMMAADRIGRQVDSDAGELPQLGRQGRDFAQWTKSLKAMLNEGFRQGHVPKVRVVETLNDPQAREDERLGAAMALMHSDPELAKRLAREAANACANQDLAQALVALAEDELDAPTAEKVGEA